MLFTYIFMLILFTFMFTSIYCINLYINFFTEKFGNRDYVLTITGVTPDHDAEFTCLARNNAGEAKSSAQLLIEGGEGKSIESR